MVVDRIESVNFKDRDAISWSAGCVPHFDQGMHGYVNVKA